VVTSSHGRRCGVTLIIKHSRSQKLRRRKVWSNGFTSSLLVEIKKAYRKLAMSLHPDKLQLNSLEDKVRVAFSDAFSKPQARAEQNFVRLAKAYEVLSDEKVQPSACLFLRLCLSPPLSLPLCLCLSPPLTVRNRSNGSVTTICCITRERSSILTISTTNGIGLIRRSLLSCALH
jgi:hypothetical protein